MNIRKFFKSEDGASAVIVALSFTMILGFVALGVDLGAAYTSKVDMQDACDLAALAGAKQLPDTGKAISVALQYVQKNGYTACDATANIIGAGEKVEVTIKKKKKAYFAGAIGVKELNISARAVAGMMAIPKPNAFDYAIFAANENANLKFANGNYYIYGKAHSNGQMHGTTYTYAYEYSSTNGGNMTGDSNVYTIDQTDNYTTEGDDWSSKAAKLADAKKYNGTPVYHNKVDTPWYLADAMMDLIPPEGSVSIPDNSHWNKKYSDVKESYFGTSSNIKLSIGGTQWTSYKWSNSGDIYFDLNSNTQITMKGDTILSGDVYITNPGKTTTFNCSNTWEGGRIIINGNLICLSGDLDLSGVEVNGNIYAPNSVIKVGSGAYDVAINNTYTYCKEFHTRNSVKVAGALVAKGNIKLQGGMTEFDADSSLTVYSINGDIEMGCAGEEIHGVIFAPNGTFRTVANVSVYGNIIADFVELPSGNIWIYPLDVKLPYDTEDPNPSAGSGEVKLLE